MTGRKRRPSPPRGRRRHHPPPPPARRRSLAPAPPRHLAASRQSPPNSLVYDGKMRQVRRFHPLPVKLPTPSRSTSSAPSVTRWGRQVSSLALYNISQITYGNVIGYLQWQIIIAVAYFLSTKSMICSPGSSSYCPLVAVRNVGLRNFKICRHLFITFFRTLLCPPTCIPSVKLRGQGSRPFINVGYNHFFIPAGFFLLFSHGKL